ncbi:hypothetical protein [Halorussus halophilus]|uniref:hypothetical protein n=1 Tax=Halorussus halophilus TaxID=2650975 RepID=UPI001300E25C|nr:hypothetical protein [Halorussus halophilus]
MKRVLWVAMGLLVLGCLAGAATADSGPPSAPDEGTTTANESTNATTVPPGQQLAGVVGAQEAAVEGELWNRTLSERLANASSAEERAELLAEEVETIEAYVEALESARGNLTESWEDGDISKGEYRTSLSGFVVRARTVEIRANRTTAAVAELPSYLREEEELNVTEVRDLCERAHALYQFEDRVASDVVEQTLGNESRLVGHGVAVETSGESSGA